MVMKKIVTMVTTGLVLGTSAAVLAQTPGRAAALQTPSAVQADRYQLGLMESVLRSAAEHGAKLTRDLAKAVVPGDMLLSDEVRVRGVRLPEYGVFFYVDMPDLEETPLWILRTLDQNGLGRTSALRQLEALVESKGTPNDRQALQTLQMLVVPAGQPASGTGSLAGGTTRTGAAAATTNDRTSVAMNPILTDPQAVYRQAVAEAIIDAILDHSSGLRLEPKDWFTVAVRGTEEAGRLSPADSDSPTIQISVRGEDLIALLARQISREELRDRVFSQIKVF